MKLDTVRALRRVVKRSKIISLDVCKISCSGHGGCGGGGGDVASRESSTRFICGAATYIVVFNVLDSPRGASAEVIKAIDKPTTVSPGFVTKEHLYHPLQHACIDDELTPNPNAPELPVWISKFAYNPEFAFPMS